MSIFGKIAKTVIKTATLPVDVVKDVATLGGLSTDQDAPYTLQKGRGILDAIEELGDEIDDL